MRLSGVTLPTVFDVMVVLVPQAPLGLVLLIAGAATTHAERSDGHMHHRVNCGSAASVMAGWCLRWASRALTH